MSDKTDEYEQLSWVFTAWWRGLQSLDGDTGKQILRGSSPVPPDRQSLAQLRRINVVDYDGTGVVDVGGALGVSAFRTLIQRARSQKLNEYSSVRKWLSDEQSTLEPFVIAAAALARIREDSSDGKVRRGATAQLLGQEKSKADTDPLFAEARFKRLIRSNDNWPDLMAQARRVSAILERSAPVGDFAASLVLWNADPSIKRDWSFQYYKRDFEPAGDSTAPPSSPSVTA